MSWYRPLVERAAADHGLDPDLVHAVVLVESSGIASAYRYEPDFWRRYLADSPRWRDQEPRRVSASYGLMQIMWPVAVELGCQEMDPEILFIPHRSLYWGCRKLKADLDWASGYVSAALAAYNGGRVGNAPGGPLRNAAYAEKVYARYERIKAA